MSDIPITFAFIGGLVSFLSPCVLPLIPGLFAYLAGSSLEEEKTNRKEIFLNSVFFVLGFSIVFALAGVLLNTVLESVAYDVQIWLGRIGGVLIIFFGLYLAGLIKLKFLEKEHKLRIKTKFNSRYLTSFLFGFAFAVGWTPCVGAVLGAILALAAVNAGSAFVLLFTYALGLGLPFLIVGAFASESQKLIAKLGPWLKRINILFGIFLIFLGVLVFTGNLSQIANLEILNKFLLK